jgi:hypothetical protein
MRLISPPIKTIIAYLFLLSYTCLFVFQNIAVYKQSKNDYTNTSKADTDDDKNIDDDICDKDEGKKAEEICNKIFFTTFTPIVIVLQKKVKYDIHQASLYSLGHCAALYTPPDFI